MKVTEIIVEGKHDPHTFKAVFMMGVPGSGKTTIAKRMIAGTGLKMVNSDSVYEWLTMKAPDPIITKGYEDELYKHSNRLVRQQMENYIDGRLGLLIDSTGRNIDRIVTLKHRLEALGYETMAVFVNADLNTALDRNDARKRRVDPKWIRDKHARIQANLGTIQGIFGGNLIIVDNSEGADLNMIVPRHHVVKFINAAPRMPQAKKWLSEDVRQTEDYGQRLRELDEVIRTQCQPWVREIGGPSKLDSTIFYRGIKRVIDEPWQVLPVVQDRRPQDSSVYLHEFFNEVIARSGLVANRSNAMFVSSNEKMTKPYGTTYVVVPIGEFHYTWSTVFRDWYGSSLDHISYFTTQRSNIIKTSGGAMYANIIQKSLQGDDNSLQAAHESTNEVMIHAKNAIYIHPEVWQDLVQYHLSK